MIDELLASVPFYALILLLFFKERKEGEKISTTGKLIVDELRTESTADKSLAYKIMAEIREWTRDMMGIEAPDVPVPQAEGELTRKYSDVSNKYNEILELVTASHQSISQLMVEMVDLKSDVNYRFKRLEHYNLNNDQIMQYETNDKKKEKDTGEL